ncbi:MAG: AI-2E family transporter [Acidobacteriota bacterium]
MGDFQLQDSQDKGARFLLVAASLVVVIAGLRAASSLILPFLFALFLAMISFPLLHWLQSRKMPAALAVLITLLAAVSAVVIVGLLASGSVRSFTDQAPQYQAHLQEIWNNALNRLQARGIDVPQNLSTELFNPGRVMDLITGSLTALAAVLSNLVLVLLTIAFILMEAAGFPAKLQAAFGEGRSLERFARCRRQVQRYLGVKTLVSVVTGVSISLALIILRVDFPLTWGLLAFLLNYVPTLGSLIAAVPPVLLALVQYGFGTALVVALVFLAINMLLGSFVEPYLLGRQLGLSALVVFLSLVFWGWIWGPAGMLLSVPLTMLVKIMLENTEDLRWVAVLLEPSPGRPIAPLRPTGE